ncbi:MAG: hypothetical protein QOK49_4500 [Baekduia sp.]|nr:hypothetical protein [Baekduia sp.]
MRIRGVKRNIAPVRLFEDAMRPTLIIATSVLLALGGAAGPARASERVPLSAKTTACTTGPDATSRAAAFTGSMPTATGAARLQMRFLLAQRLGAAGPYKSVAVPGWGAWEKSDPGRAGFVFTKRVESLAAPASYRAVVTFRWTDQKGHTLRTATRTTTACVQPDPRPDLVLAGVDATPRSSDAVYTVGVANDGHADAGVFSVVVAVDGVAQPPLTLGPIPPGERRQGTIVGAKCTPGSTITVTVDATGVVDEITEDDDVVQRPCPLG